MPDPITVVVNGQEREFGGEMSLTDLLQALDLDPQAVVVELNKEIVRRPALGDTTVRNGDQVELVHFVGGG
ncbi:MAG: sulfur carrier protein ThiS [Gemmatimonadales bacterium]